MKFVSALLVVNDISVSKEFYQTVFGLKVDLDFGSYLSFTDGPILQTRESFAETLEFSEKTILMRPHNVELYFEEKNFDEFLKKIEPLDLDYIHHMTQYSWGQRIIRFYDPDMHIIEVGESMDTVIKNCLREGLSVEETKDKTKYPEKMIQKCQREITKKNR